MEFASPGLRRYLRNTNFAVEAGHRLDADDLLYARVPYGRLGEVIGLAKGAYAKSERLGSVSTPICNDALFEIPEVVYYSPKGADAYAGTVLTQPEGCGFTFMGYAIPLVEHPETLKSLKDSVFAARNGGKTCPGGEFAGDTAVTSVYGSTALNFHVSTTSTAAVYIREHLRYRIYMQSPALTDSETGDSSFPTGNPVLPGYEHLPGRRAWKDSGRFDSTKIGFVDSCDGGYTFPVYGPSVDYEEMPDNSDGSCNFVWGSGDFSQAGWTSTAIPCKTSEGDDVDSDGIYLLYNEASVIDLYDEYGLYLMICIECRSTVTSADGGCTGCIFAEGTTCTNCATQDVTDKWGTPEPKHYPTGFTRIVMFVSDSPDFPEGAVYPVPGYSDAAMVLLQAEFGGTGPNPEGDSDCPNEQYGVHHALLTPDRATLLLYVPWNADPSYGPNARVTDYFNDTDYPFNDSYNGQPLWEMNSGISCFAIDVDALMAAVRASWESFASSGDGVSARHTRTSLEELVAGYYQGEVLITDGVTRTPDPSSSRSGSIIPTMLGNTDPQFAFDGFGDLWVYYDVGHTTASTESGVASDQDTLHRGRLVPASELPDFADALSLNGEYTVFLVESCGQLADFRELFASVPYDEAAADQGWPTNLGRLIGDPDPTYLVEEVYGLSWRARVLFSGGQSGGEGSSFHGGLLYVVGPWETWDWSDIDIDIDQWSWADGILEMAREELESWFW